MILAAAKIAGVDRIFKTGGAQAVAALAYGTQSVPKVDKIVGPGNAFVAEAKRQVFGLVAIDMISRTERDFGYRGRQKQCGLCRGRHAFAGGARQAGVKRRARHGQPGPRRGRARRRTRTAACAELAARGDRAEPPSSSNGKIIVADRHGRPRSTVANEIAPEHLGAICTDNPFDYLDTRRARGQQSSWDGSCPEALGDYFAGPNHTLPTTGTARFSSPLSVDDFVKKSQYAYYTKDALGAVADQIALFARKEGLEAHAKSVTIRMDKA